MAVIDKDFGVDGDDRSHDSHGRPNLADALRDIADDLAAGKAATIAAADASDLATAITLVNEIKAALNAVASTTVLTTKG